MLRSFSGALYPIGNQKRPTENHASKTSSYWFVNLVTGFTGIQNTPSP